MAEARGLGEDQDLLAALERLLGELEVVHVVQRALAALEDQVDVGGLLRQRPQRHVDVLEGLPAAGRRDVRRAVQRTVGRAGAQLDEAARAAGGGPHGHLLLPVEPVGAEGDPVAVVDIADGLAAVGAGLLDDRHARLGGEVLALAVQRLEHGAGGAGQGLLAVRPAVGVAGADDAVDVGVGVVAAVTGGRLQGALAAHLAGQLVGVGVVAEAVDDLDLGAVDGLLGVGDGHLERDGLAEFGQGAVAGDVDPHLGLGVADHDPDAGVAGVALGVLRGEGGAVGADLLVLVGGVEALALGTVAEVPAVGEVRGVGVLGRAGELDLQAGRPGRLVGAHLGDRREAVLGVLDPVQRGVLVALEPGDAVVEDVERAVGAELHVHDLGAGPREVVDLRDGAVVVLLDPLDPPAAELTREEVAVVRLGELHAGVELRVVTVDRAGHRGLGAVAELGHGAAVVRDPGGLRGRQVDQARVVRRGVLRGVAVELLAGLLGGEVVVDVGVVGAGAEGPAEVGRLGHLGELDLSARAALGVGGTGVGAVVADVHDAGLVVDAHPERVAEAHRVDLRTGLLRARGEEVALRDRVRAVLGDLDTQDLAAQVVGVGGAAAGVEGRVAVRPVVDRRVAVRGEGVGVVAGRQVEVAVRVEVDVAADVAAGAAGGRDVEDLLLAGHVQRAVGVQHEAGEAVDAVELLEVLGGAGLRGIARGGVERRGVVEVDRPVVLEVRVDADALEAFLVVAVDGDLAGDLGDAALVGEAERAVARGVQDAAVREHGERHRLARLGFALGERHLLELALCGCRFVLFRLAGLGSGDGGGGAHGEEQAGEQGDGGAQPGPPGGAGASGSGSVHEVPPGTGWAVRNGCGACGAGAGVRRHPGGTCVLNASRKVTVSVLGQHPLDQDRLSFLPAQDRAGSGQVGGGPAGGTGPRPRPAPGAWFSC
ncbi:hypothetical protein STAFG_7696 [Streptomyces afghaniensis 772]|uniref:Uncharacterized protein n=1 Tax=Streptomyces afghaniensis 772 TaxID=1283301 RepID=S4NAY7_9ACTN|nr:hypothetical protein STAFG_7696 [Streptomyces afghaniensis 772]